MKDLEGYIQEAIKNIREDRAVTATLLTDLLIYLKGEPERQKETGQVAAKYVETLQRSNEQLVKIAALVQKKDSSRSLGLTDLDKNELFDILDEVKDNDPT